MSDKTTQQATIKRATLTAQRQVFKLDADTLEELASLYQQAADDLSSRIDSYSGPDGNISLQEMQSVLEQVYIRLKALSNERNALINKSLSTSADLGTKPFSLSSAAAMQINHDALHFVRTFVAEDGLQLSDRIWRLDRLARDKVSNAIEMAVIQGQGATQAAREFLSRGQPVPVDLQDKINSASARKIAKETTDALLTGQGSPMDNAMRVMRTEINRAHGEAYIKGALSHPDSAGVRFLLSPGHPKHDICDLYATQNLYGLGSGVYPNRGACPWPAHPNTLSFVEVVFKDEVTAADQAGKETPLQALDRMTPAQRIGVLGVNKHQAFKDGKLTQGMIKAPWSVVQKRIGINKPVPLPVKKQAISGLDEYISAGRGISTDLFNRFADDDIRHNGALLLEKLHDQLRAARPMMSAAKIQNGGKGADLVKAASMMFPDDWTRAADRHGPLFAKLSAARGEYMDLSHYPPGRNFRQYGFSGVTRGGEGFIRTDRFSTAVHEYSHRLQHAIPALDDIFQTLHQRRTAKDPLERLRDLYPRINYRLDEVVRKDHYRNYYQGKIYSKARYLGKQGALEVMTMAFEDVLGGNAKNLEVLIEADREMFDLVVGLLFNYVP
ncbi:MAG: hypothetical protein WC208_09650 [Gallionella sp.]|jgi:hypothetical protein